MTLQRIDLKPIAGFQNSVVPGRCAQVVIGLPPDLHATFEDAVDFYDGSTMDMAVLSVLVREKTPGESEAVRRQLEVLFSDN